MSTETGDLLIVIAYAGFFTYLLLYFASDRELWAVLVRGRIYLEDPWLRREPWPQHEPTPSARQRRERLSAYLREPHPKELVETREGFIEMRELSYEESVAQLVTFQWQEEDDYLLRLARASDVATRINRDFAKGGGPDLITAVSLRRLSHPRYRLPLPLPPLHKDRESSPRSPQLCVIVHTKRPALVAKLLTDSVDWLDIGLAVERPGRHAEETGRCIDPGSGKARGLVGRVGGYLIGRTTQGMTCSHVLANGCAHEAFRIPLAEHMGPDVALIDSGPCFESLVRPRHVQAHKVRSGDLQPGLAVRMVPYHRIDGELHEITLSASYARRTHKFAHAYVTAPLPRLFDIPLPRWPLRFSQRGDSGSWVIACEGDLWVGMVVGGTRFWRTGYLVLAHPLMKYLIRLGKVPPHARIAIEETDK